MFSKGYGIEILEKLAETLVPGESKELLKLAQLGTDTERHQVTNVHASNEIVHNLKQIYDSYIVNNIPFAEEVRLIAFLPHSWNYEDIIKTFGCSRHAMETAHRMQDESECMLKFEKEPQIRQCTDHNKVKHFASWLAESNTLVSRKIDPETHLQVEPFFLFKNIYGLTILRMDSDEEDELSKQILQVQNNARYR